MESNVVLSGPEQTGDGDHQLWKKTPVVEEKETENKQ